MLYSPSSKANKAFTLVEIMIVVAIIALLAAIAIPNFMRARKRSQATSFLNTLRMIDGAKEQYCMEHNKSGVTPTVADLMDYAKPGSTLYAGLVTALGEGGAGTTSFWDAKFYHQIDYEINDPSTPPDIVAVNCSYSDVCDSDFWGGYSYSER